MEVKCKSKVTATANCSRTAGGPYVDLVEGEELYLEQAHAEYLQERGKLKIVSYDAKKETSDEDDVKDRLIAQAKTIDVKLTKNMKIDTMKKKITDAGHEPDLGEGDGDDDDSDSDGDGEGDGDDENQE